MLAMCREQDKYYYYVHFTNDDIADTAQAHTARKWWSFLDFFLALLFHCRDLTHNNVIKLNFDQLLEFESLKTTY